MTRALTLLALCLALLLGGVGWITATALRLEDSEARARRQAALEETVRLALWRLDSNLSSLFAREAARPYFHYLPIYPIGRPFDEMMRPVEPYEAFARSPLDRPSFPDVLVYFQIAPDGTLTSPQTGAGARARLDALRPILDRRAFLTERAQPPTRQLEKYNAEYQLRSKNVQQAQNALSADVAVVRAEEPGALRPLWLDGHLFLVRDVSGYLQGLELAWPVVRDDLLATIRDLLPEARLEAAGSDAPAERLLASLPVRLEPGRPVVSAEATSSTRLVLGAAWIAVLVACGTVAALLFGALALGERRGAFVSAVTHELRTPLTTLRTYTEMLEAEMVPPDKRPSYLRTLAREADRLARLVDNVLAYARLERGRRPAVVAVTTAELLERSRPLLEGRAAAAGVVVTIDPGDAAPVKADPAAVEQILFNLVENACKYGGGSPVRVFARGAGLGVADGGPGISDRRRLFEPFHRSAERAAGSAPGVGLGLALCRRLARAMGGDLVLAPGPGATFELRLPPG